jgi:periplasmic divalent cation tolerance protein
MAAFLIWCPFPDEAEARNAAGLLLDEGLIACANIVPGLVSLYVWHGERGEAGEVGLLAKTHPSLGEAAIARLEQLHSYQTPAIIGLHSDRVASATREWLDSLVEAGST